MNPYDPYSVTFPLWLGSLWLVVTFVWLLLPLCLHLWHSRHFEGQDGRSSLVEYARDGVLCRISLVFVFVFLGLALLWADNYWVWFFAGAGVVAIILFLSQDVFKRSRGPSSDKRGISAAALGSERKRVSSPLAGEHASLGPCSEEAEAALTDEAMLSLWYGGLNGIYARKCRAAGRWIGTPLNHTPPEYLRAWASDNPYLRTSAYYCKSMLGYFAVVVALMLNVSKNVMNVVRFWVRESYNIPSRTYLWYHLVLFTLAFSAVMSLPFIYSWLTSRKWITHYRTLSRALSEGRDPDLCDRARMGEMRRTILGWAWNSGYVRYDREKGWRLNTPSKGSKGGRLIE